MRGASVHSTRSESRTLERGASSNCNSNSLNTKGVQNGIRWGTWNIGSYKGKDGELENVLEKFWKLEECPNPNSKIKNLVDEKVHEEFKKTITYDDVNQQYMVKIPYKEEVKKLLDNFVPTKALYWKQQAILKNDPEKRTTVQ